MQQPLVLHLSRDVLARGDAVSQVVARARVPSSARAHVVAAFQFKDAELAFARALSARTNLWIWRVHQQRFAGDFLVVDLSAADPARRPVLAVDLKRDRPVRVDRPGVQMKDARRALDALARARVLGAGAAPLYVTGDARHVLREMPALLERARAVLSSASERSHA
jgi:hypothetical protein